jgi:hypothetical protein
LAEQVPWQIMRPPSRVSAGPWAALAGLPLANSAGSRWGRCACRSAPGFGQRKVGGSTHPWLGPVRVTHMLRRLVGMDGG